MVNTQVSDEAPDTDDLEQSELSKEKPVIADSRPKKPIGRPPKDPGTIPSPIRIDLPPVPFFNFWRDLTTPQLNNGTVYVYRMNPVVDVKHKRLTLAKAKGEDVVEDDNATTNIAKLTIPFGQGITGKLTDADIVREILQLFGCGDYTFGLNDAQRKGNKKQVCRTFVSTPHDYANHPPILDINTLVMDDYKNEPYIKYLRSRGDKLPGDEEVKEEQEDDLAKDAALEAMATSLGKMTDKVIEKNQSQPVAITPTVVQAPPVPGVDQEIIKGVFTMAKEMQAGHSQAQDPLAMIRSVGQVLNEFRQGPTTDPAVMALLTSMQTKLDNQERLEIERVRQENADLKAGRAEVLPPTPPKSLLETVDEALALVDRFKGLAGGGATEPDDPIKKTTNGILGTLMGSEMPWWGPVAGTILSNIAVAFITRGMPMPQVPGMPMGGMTGMPPMPQQPGQPPQMPPPMPIAGQVQQPVPPQQPNPVMQDDPMTQAIGMLQTLAPFMINHLDLEKSGYEFAEFVIAGWKRPAYDMIKQVGKDTIKGAFQFHAEMAAYQKRAPERVDKFVEEFFTLDDMPTEDEPEPEVQTVNGTLRKVRRPNAPTVPGVP